MMFAETNKVRIPCQQKPDANRKIDANFIECEVAYTLGGMNPFTSRAEARGYYIHVSPILVANRCITYQGFSGFKSLLVTATRKGKGKERQAREIAETAVTSLIERVCSNWNLEVIGQ